MGHTSLEYQPSSREVSALFPSYHPLRYHNAIVLLATSASVRLVVGYYKMCIYGFYVMYQLLHQMRASKGSIDEVDAAPIDHGER
jgi:hypothetical protein